MRFGEIQLEVTSLCNLRCKFCPEGSVSRAQGTMSKNRAFEIIETIAKHGLSDTLVFHVLGEPLLHPQINDIVAYASKHLENTHLYTNVTLLNANKLEGLLDAGVTELHLSVQSHDDVSHRAKFPGKSYQPFSTTLEMVALAIQKKIQTRHPKKILKIKHAHALEREYKARASAFKDTILSNVVQTKMQIRELVSLYQEMVSRNSRVENRDVESAIEKWNGVGGLNLILYPGIELRLLPVDTWGNSLGDTTPYRLSFGRCRPISSLTTMAISWDGRIVFCCYDADFKNSVGQITDKKALMEILDSKEAKQFIRSRKLGLLKSSKCQECLGSYSKTRLYSRALGSLFYPVEPCNSY